MLLACRARAGLRLFRVRGGLGGLGRLAGLIEAHRRRRERLEVEGGLDRGAEPDDLQRDLGAGRAGQGLLHLPERHGAGRRAVQLGDQVADLQSGGVGRAALLHRYHQRRSALLEQRETAQALAGGERLDVTRHRLPRHVDRERVHGIGDPFEGAGHQRVGVRFVDVGVADEAQDLAEDLQVLEVGVEGVLLGALGALAMRAAGTLAPIGPAPGARIGRHHQRHQHRQDKEGGGDEEEQSTSVHSTLNAASSRGPRDGSRRGSRSTAGPRRAPRSRPTIP